MNTKIIAIITAGGIGSRTGQSIPKQFIHINKENVVKLEFTTFSCRCDTSVT